MILTVHAKPNARKSEITHWIDEDTVKISIAAPPEKGKANRELIQFLSKTFHTPKQHIELVRGVTAKIKQLRVPDVWSDQIKKMAE